MNKYYCITYAWRTSNGATFFENAAIDVHPVDWFIEAFGEYPDDNYTLISSHEVNYDQYIKVKELV